MKPFAFWNTKKVLRQGWAMGREPLESGDPRLFSDVWGGFAVIILKSFSTIIRNLQ